MCRIGSLGSGQTLVASSYEHRDELLCLKIQILWNVILCWLLNRSFLIRLLENVFTLNPLNAELNPICHLLALLGAHHFLHVSRIRVKSLTLRLLMSYIYGAPIIDVS